MKQPTKYGFYSAQAAYQFGTVFYKTPEGGEVEVTSVGLDSSGEYYKLADKFFIGEVTTFVRDGIKIKDELNFNYNSG